MDKKMPADPKRIVIIGGGIAGVCTAYYLKAHANFDDQKHEITLIEAGDIAGGASGKAGGFLASWATPKCLAPLSFRLHEELATKLNGTHAWGYRNVHAAEVNLKPCLDGAKIPDDAGTDESSLGEVKWLDHKLVREFIEIGTPKDSAQAHPGLLTRTLASYLESNGVKFVSGAAQSISSADGKVDQVTYIGNGGSPVSIDATDVVVAAGPWTPKLVPEIKLLTPKGHSLVVKPTSDISPHILFLSIDQAEDPTCSMVSPDDIYPRPTDSVHNFHTVYSSGPDYYDSPLPTGTKQVVLEEAKLDEVWHVISKASKKIKGGDILTRQACYKAQIRKHEDGEEVGPIVGPMDGVENLWVATGFDEWGIQNGPGAGLVLSEMILEGRATSADVESLHPKHFTRRADSSTKENTGVVPSSCVSPG